MRKNTIDDVVLALSTAPVDPRTGNKVLYSVDWLATQDSMIGKINEDWVRRELDWFASGSDKLSDMEAPVPQLFQACAGRDGRVNSAYGHILFNPAVIDRSRYLGDTLYNRIIDTIVGEGPGTRHAVAIISDRDIHTLAHLNERNDFICTNALNVMIDDKGRVNIIAQMRSMDAVFGYRADYSMWDYLIKKIVIDLNNMADAGTFSQYVSRGDITFQVANLHVYPRHFQLLEDTADDIEERIQRRVWRDAEIEASA